MAQVFGLSENDVAKVKTLVSAYEGGRLVTQVPPPRFTTSPPLPTYMAQTTEKVAASSGEPVNTIVEVYVADLVTGVLSDQNISLSAWSLNSFVIAANEWVLCIREPYSGLYFIIPFTPTGGLECETLFECLGNTLYKATLCNHIVTSVTQSPACCGMSGSSGGSGSGGGYTGNIGFSLGCNYPPACLGLDGSLADQFCLAYDGVVNGCQQWSYTATGINIIVQLCGCLLNVLATFPGTTFSGFTLDNGCGALPTSVSLGGGGYGGLGCTGNLSNVCYSPSNYWCVQANLGDNSACGPGSLGCFLDSALSPQPIITGKSVTWTASGHTCVGTIISGPYTSAGACEAVCVGCGEGEVATSCCPCMPQTLTITMNGTASCSWTLTYDGVGEWEGSGSCCQNLSARLACTGNGGPPEWELTIFTLDGGTGTYITGFLDSCSPFVWSSSGTITGGTCAGNFSVTITE